MQNKFLFLNLDFLNRIISIQGEILVALKKYEQS